MRSHVPSSKDSSDYTSLYKQCLSFSLRLITLSFLSFYKALLFLVDAKQGYWWAEEKNVPSRDGQRRPILCVGVLCQDWRKRTQCLLLALIFSKAQGYSSNLFSPLSCGPAGSPFVCCPTALPPELPLPPERADIKCKGEGRMPLTQPAAEWEGITMAATLSTKPPFQLFS